MMTMAMQDTLASLRAHGVMELRRSGVWTIASEPTPPQWWVSPLTVRALVARGLVEKAPRYNALRLTAAGARAADAQAVRR